MQHQMSFLDSLCGKMSQEHSAATEEKTFKQSSKRSQTLSETPMILFLDLRGGGGNLLGAFWDAVGALPGVSTICNTSAAPSVVKESTLSQILDLNAPEKYSLSPTACAGILRRAEKRGKELPDMLKDALMEVVSSCGEMIADEPDEDINDFDVNTDDDGITYMKGANDLMRTASDNEDI